VILAAAVVPGPPLLAPALGGGDVTVVELRRACIDALSDALGDGPELVAVVGGAASSATWPDDARADLASYGAAMDPPAHPAPLSVGMGCLLLDAVGYHGPRLIRTVAVDSTMDECRAVAADVAHAAGRVCLVVVADGTARRTPKAPGHLDERAERYDAAVERAVATGDLAALLDLDPTLAAELLASGWAPLQVLAFALHSPQSTIHYCAAPFGVGYLAATLTPRLAGRSS